MEIFKSKNSRIPSVLLLDRMKNPAFYSYVGIPAAFILPEEGIPRFNRYSKCAYESLVVFMLNEACIPLRDC
jgi:hypothetical protein